MRHRSIAFASKKDTGLCLKTEKKPSVMQPGSCTYLPCYDRMDFIYGIWNIQIVKKSHVKT